MVGEITKAGLDAYHAALEDIPRKPTEPLTGGKVNKGGHNEGPSQITTRPPSPAPITHRSARQDLAAAARAFIAVMVSQGDALTAEQWGALEALEAALAAHGRTWW